MVFLSFVSGGGDVRGGGRKSGLQSGGVLKKWLSARKSTGSGSKRRPAGPAVVPSNRQSCSGTEVYGSSAVPIGVGDAQLINDAHKQRVRRSMPVIASLPIAGDASQTIVPDGEHSLTMVPPEQLLPSTRTFQTRKDSMIRRIPARYTSPTPLAASGAPLGAGSGTGTILQLDGNLQQPNNCDSDFVVVSPTRLDSRLLPRVEAKSRVPWRKRSLIYAMYHTVQNDDTTPPAAASAATAATAATTTTADEPLVVCNPSCAGTDVTTISDAFASCESIAVSLYRELDEDSQYASVSSIPSLGGFEQGSDGVTQYTSADIPLLSAINEVLWSQDKTKDKEEDGRAREAGQQGCRTRTSTMASDVCSVGTSISDCGPASSLPEALLLVGPAYVCSERYAPRLSTIVRANDGQLVIKPSKQSLRESGSTMSSSDEVAVAVAVAAAAESPAVGQPSIASAGGSPAEAGQAQVLGLDATDLGISILRSATCDTGRSSKYQQAVLESLVACPPHQGITPDTDFVSYMDRATSADGSTDGFRRTGGAVIPKTQSPQHYPGLVRIDSGCDGVAQTSGRSPVAVSYSGGSGKARVVAEWGSELGFGSVEPTGAKNTATSSIPPQPEDTAFRRLLVGVPFAASVDAGTRDASARQDHLESDGSSNGDSLTTFADDCEEHGSVGSSTAAGGSTTVHKGSSVSLELSQSFSNCSSRGGDLLGLGSPARACPGHSSDAQHEGASILGGAGGGHDALGSCPPQLQTYWTQRPGDRDFVSSVRPQSASAAEQRLHAHAREPSSDAGSGSGHHYGLHAASRHAMHAVPEVSLQESGGIALSRQAGSPANASDGRHDSSSSRSLSSTTRKLRSAFAKGKKLAGLRQLQRKIAHQRSLSLSSTSNSSSSQSPRKAFRFNELVAVYETWDSEDYDRRGVPAIKLDTELVQLIKQELNEFKVYEMAVHEESRCNTHFIF